LLQIDGLAEAVARANLGADVLAKAAAWAANAGARSVTQLEKDDIDGAVCLVAYATAGVTCGPIARLARWFAFCLKPCRA
jgi:hypothetical protein